MAAVEAYTSDKCYPIEHEIAVVENEIGQVLDGLGGDVTPQQRAAATAGLRKQLMMLEEQLKICRQ